MRGQSTTLKCLPIEVAVFKYRGIVKFIVNEQLREKYGKR